MRSMVVVLGVNSSYSNPPTQVQSRANMACGNPEYRSVECGPYRRNMLIISVLDMISCHAVFHRERSKLGRLRWMGA
jgi:hypothetical protein